MKSIIILRGVISPICRILLVEFVKVTEVEVAYFVLAVPCMVIARARREDLVGWVEGRF